METMMTNELPRSVKIGYRTYRIENWPTREAVGAGRYGEASHTSGVIRIDASYGPHQTVETLLHEILHCVATMWALSDDDREERIVTLMANGLTTVWRDNPDVFAWITANVQAA